MAATPEGKVKDQIKKLLRDKQIWFFMPVPGRISVHGVPDFICCWNGRFLAIEAKAPGRRGNTTPNQDQRIKEIQRADGVALVVDDVEQLKEVLESGVQGQRSGARVA